MVKMLPFFRNFFSFAKRAQKNYHSSVIKIVDRVSRRSENRAFSIRGHVGNEGRKFGFGVRFCRTLRRLHQEWYSGERICRQEERGEVFHSRKTAAKFFTISLNYFTLFSRSPQNYIKMALQFSGGFFYDFPKIRYFWEIRMVCSAKRPI